MTDEHVPAPPKGGAYLPDSITLYGVKLNDKTDYAVLNANEKNLRLQLMKRLVDGSVVDASSTDYSVALAYGYAFDGHCYRFDTLRIFIVTGPFDEDAVGCGFDLPNSGTRYRMWRIRSSTELLELETRYGDAKTLVLDDNLPGRRAPTSYAINMSMGHRGGRLTRE